MTDVTMAINLVCNFSMCLCGMWLLTEPSMSRVVRIYCALIACGGAVNTAGMLAALTDFRGFSYGDVWPGEAIVNVGAAAMMLRWTWRARRRRKGLSVDAQHAG
ncbi:hypothetical protein L2Y94_18785 [Luteibacter aegosomatis]|uniref:hypothetical protein n=1 Tax=Luteibacter aegosomatis TaxID=2911537 RepID=UPI001FF99648|nr:hypothetical protein [Luteibacter aegosomatis]UPG85326.1 hypothetical protein L2Y94_18785 [Luteibacter aegosomatis]